KESQQKFKSLFYLSPIAIMVYDHQGLLADANSAAISIFGQSDESMLSSGKLFTHPLLNISDRVKISRGISIDSDISLDYDHERSQYQFPSSRSGTGHLRVMVSPISHPSNAEIGWYLAQVIDETERKKAEIANVVNELKYRSVFANVSHGLILFELLADGETGPILDMNPKAEELIQRTLSDALADADLVQNYLDISGSNLGISRHTETGEVCTREMALQIYGGGYIPVFVTFVLFRIADKKVGLAVVEDITQKKKYEEERVRMIQQIEKNLAELAILNDGIRNPLTVIMLIVDELDEKIANPVLTQIRIIDHLIDTLDKRWLESEKILQFLRKHHHAHLDLSNNDTRKN
ncbi:MAG: PAS domain S-box protein, partial [Methanospirillum sp.]|uniref:PAS domain-containing protein n=1 Tax=Methanospirillum sp. TaxID=45200 RepID=UPI0023749AEA